MADKEHSKPGERHNSPTSEFCYTLASGKLGDLASELSELMIDELSRSELVTKLPVIGALRALYDGAATIHNAIFERKILKFLAATDTATRSQMQDFVEQLEQ